MIGRSARIVSEAVGFLLAGLAVLVAFGAWRLSSGPVEVDFLTPYLEDALSEGAVRLSLGDTSLRWDGFRQPLRLVATDVALYGDGPLPVARVPALSIALGARGIVQGRILPREIELVEPRVRIERSADGTFRFGLGELDAPADEAGSKAVAALLTALRAAPGDRSHPLAAIETVRISRGRIIIVDHMLGARWRAPRADIDLRRVADGVRGSARLDVELGDRVARLEADLDYRSDSGETMTELRVENIVPADLAAMDPVLAPLEVLASPVAGTLRVRFGPNFLPRTTTFELAAGAGVLRIDEFFPDPLRVAALGMAGSIDLRAGIMTVDRFTADLGGPRLEGSAIVRDHGGMLDIVGTASVAMLPTDLLATYWPKGVGRGARKWVTGHLSRGLARRAEARVLARMPADDFGALRLLDLSGGISFDGVTVDYLDDMPPVTEVAGTAAFDLKTFDLDLTTGQLRDLSVPEAEVSITGLETGRESIDIEVVATGPAATVMTVLDSPRLGYASEMGIDPAAVDGLMSARLRFAFPLIRDLDFDDVALAAAANLQDVRLGEVVDGIVADSIDGALSLDGRGMEVSGKARLNGVPVDIAWTENFGAGEAFQRRIRLTGILDDAARSALNLPAYDGLTGPIPVEAVYTEERDRTATLVADLDLAPARLAVGHLGWIKEPGVAARARLALELKNEELQRLSQFTLTGDGLIARGDATFAPGTTDIAVLQLAEFAYGRNHFSARAVRRPDAGYTMEVRGRSLDASGIFDGIVGDGGGDADDDTGGTPVQATLQLDRVYVGDDRALYEATGLLVRAAEGWETIDIAAKTDTGAPMRFRFGEGTDGSDRLSLTAEDAGAALRTFGLIDTVVGGRLSIDGSRENGDPGAAFVGDVSMEGFRVVRAPALARLLAALSLSGLNDLLTSNGIEFSRLVADYRLDGDILTVSGARTSGGALGLTMDGIVDLAAGRMDVEGTIVPLSGVNRVIGAIPIIGDILTGGEGQGVFAFTYGIEGPIDDPAVTVNPLAVLAPGFLRNLFFLSGPNRPPGE